jgi:FkbM family methyltransferase
VFSALRRLTRSVTIRDGDVVYRVDTSDRVIGRSLFIGHAPEVDMVDAAMKLLMKIHGGSPVDGKVVVDVGANIGTTAIPLVKRFGARLVWAIEPEPRNLELLRINVRLNQLVGDVEIVPTAASDRTGFVLLRQSLENFGDHRVIPTGEVEAFAAMRVPVVTLDELVELSLIDSADVGLIWIDVQGHEGQVLAGASSLLTSSAAIVMEFWPAGLGQSGGAEVVQELLTSGSYASYDIRRSLASPHCLTADDIADLSERYRDGYTDLLLIPN